MLLAHVTSGPTSMVMPPLEVPFWFLYRFCLVSLPQGRIVNGHYADTEELFYPSHHGSQWTIHNGKMHKRSNFLSSLIHIVSTALGLINQMNRSTYEGFERVKGDRQHETTDFRRL